MKTDILILYLKDQPAELPPSRVELCDKVDRLATEAGFVLDAKERASIVGAFFPKQPQNGKKKQPAEPEPGNTI